MEAHAVDKSTFQSNSNGRHSQSSAKAAHWHRDWHPSGSRTSRTLVSLPVGDLFKFQVYAGSPQIS